MTVVPVGIDLAKNVFGVHGVNEAGKPALVRPEVPRAKDITWRSAPCSADHWTWNPAKRDFTCSDRQLRTAGLLDGVQSSSGNSDFVTRTFTERD